MGIAELGSKTVREVARDAEVPPEFDHQRGSPYRTVPVLRRWLALVPGRLVHCARQLHLRGGPRVVWAAIFTATCSASSQSPTPLPGRRFAHHRVGDSQRSHATHHRRFDPSAPAPSPSGVPQAQSPHLRLGLRVC